jgi:hypothetical protein
VAFELAELPFGGNYEVWGNLEDDSKTDKIISSLLDRVTLIKRIVV